jgi:glycosyltransferase involved in cell wall biosynthesis
MKTILHVIDTTGPGGAEVVFVELADRVRQLGYRSIALIRGPGWVHDALQERGLDTVVMDCKGSFNLGYLARVMRLIRERQVDVVQSHLLGSNVYAAIAGLFTRTPVVATFHGMVDVSRTERFLALKRFVLKAGTSRCVAVSKSLARALAADKLLDEAKYAVIHNGVDTERFNRNRTGWLHNELGLPESAKLVVSVGNVRPAKGYDVLVHAASLLRKSLPDLHFVIAGDKSNSLAAELNRLTTALRVDDSVHFIGFAKDSASVLAEADCFLLCSTSEGFSIATLEALAAGLPSVITACGGPEEIVTADKNALVPQPGDSTAIANCIARIFHDDALCDRLGSAGKRVVEESFSIDAMIRAYDATYREVLGVS